MKRLREEMDRAVRRKVFPGGVLLAARGDRVTGLFPAGGLTYEQGSPPVRPDTIYDLASLTKILSTTILTMIFLDTGRFHLDSDLNTLWPGDVPRDKAGLTLARLLSHSAGFPAWRPFYGDWLKSPENRRRSLASAAILDEPLIYRPGRQSIYSDLDFILLGLILEQTGQGRQDDLFEQYIAGPLGASGIGYLPTDRAPRFARADIAPTEDLAERGGLISGVVHDDNAAALSGVAGHAGLFGNVFGVWSVFSALRRAFRDEPGKRLAAAATVKKFWQRSSLAPDSDWALGFDTKSETGSSLGRYFSLKSVGHLGFTGTSLWHDPETDLTVILLTNRVHPTRDNLAIRAFRPEIHETAAQCLSA